MATPPDFPISAADDGREFLPGYERWLRRAWRAVRRSCWRQFDAILPSLSATDQRVLSFWRAFRSGRFSEAIRFATKHYDAGRAVADDALQTEAHVWLAACFLAVGDDDSARRFQASALRLAAFLPPESGIARDLASGTALHLLAGGNVRPATALMANVCRLESGVSVPTRIEAADASHEWAALATLKADWPLATRLWRRAYHLHRRLRDHYATGIALLQWSNAAYAQGQWKLAFRLAKASRKRFARADAPHLANLAEERRHLLRSLYQQHEVQPRWN